MWRRTKNSAATISSFSLEHGIRSTACRCPAGILVDRPADAAIHRGMKRADQSARWATVCSSDDPRGGDLPWRHRGWDCPATAFRPAISPPCSLHRFCPEQASSRAARARLGAVMQARVDVLCQVKRFGLVPEPSAGADQLGWRGSTRERQRQPDSGTAGPAISGSASLVAGVYVAASPSSQKASIRSGPKLASVTPCAATWPRLGRSRYAGHNSNVIVSR